MRIGITGTRQGMTDRQLMAVAEILESINERNEFHHGDCVGADFEAAIIATMLGYKTVCHPPIKEALRAFHKSTVVMPAKGYLERDRDIVHVVDVLIVVPSGKRKPRSGTWYTHDYAVKYGTEIKLLLP